jgi:hypothetical protein
MIELSKRDSSCDQKTYKLNLCEYCVYSKQCIVKFGTTIHLIKSTIDYVHFDIGGYFHVLLKGGAQYLLIFIDNNYKKV